jgi:hypothetical protein
VRGRRTALVVATLLAGLASGMYVRATDADMTTVILLPVALIVTLGVGSLVLGWSERDRQFQALATANRGIRLTGGFRAIAARLGLEDPWPGRRADDVPPPGAGLDLIAPALRGTLRGHRIHVTVCDFSAGGEGAHDGYFQIVVRARRGCRWVRSRRLHRGSPPPGLSGAALEALERLRARRADRAIDSIEVGADDELCCRVEDRITNAVTLDEARTDTALPQTTELERIVDDLVTLADGLPVQRPKGARAPSDVRTGSRSPG